eukprot:12954-Heterococcus_DN1.PRE.2
MDHQVLAVSITVLAAEVMTEGVIAEIEDVEHLRSLVLSGACCGSIATVTGATVTAAEIVETTGVMTVTAADAVTIEAVVEIVVTEMTGVVAVTVTMTGAVKRSCTASAAAVAAAVEAACCCSCSLLCYDVWLRAVFKHCSAAADSTTITTTAQCVSCDDDCNVAYEVSVAVVSVAVATLTSSLLLIHTVFHTPGLLQNKGVCVLISFMVAAVLRWTQQLRTQKRSTYTHPLLNSSNNSSISSYS